MHRLPQFTEDWTPPDPRAVSLLAKPEPAHFRSVQSSNDPDQATAQTIEIMCRHIKDSARDPKVRRAAVDAPMRFRGGPVTILATRESSAACSDWWWVKHALKFVHHELLIRQWLNESDQLQLLIPPDVLLRMRQPEGDCAVYSMLLCAMLRCQGVQYELVTVAANPGEPSIFTHVYARAVMPDGKRLPLDASHGAYPGWQVPSAHITRLQVWDEGGRPIADQGTRYDGLHSYRRRRGMRGLGDCGSCIGGYDAEAGSTCSCPGDGTTTLTNPFGLDYSTGGSYSTAGGGPATSTGSGWDKFLQSLANQWTQIGGRVIAPTTTVQRGPQGQVYISTPAGSSASSAALLGSGVGSGGTSWLLIGGLLLGGVFALKAMSGK